MRHFAMSIVTLGFLVVDRACVGPFYLPPSLSFEGFSPLSLSRHFAQTNRRAFLTGERGDSHAQRTIVIENLCDYDVFPAISPFPGNAEGYTGPTGWKAKPASKETISVPSKWSGRLCEVSLALSLCRPGTPITDMVNGGVRG